MNYRKLSTRGFTIIELLIVIVVIGILATITIVAYNGIQARAQVAKASATADSYVKLIEVNKIENEDTYPSTSGETVCLGTLADYPAENGFEEGECVYWGEDIDWRRSHNVDTDFNSATFTGSIPPGVIATVTHPNQEYPETYGTENYRGIVYENDGSYAHLHYFLNGTQTCPRGTAFPYDGITECIISLGPPDDEDLADFAGMRGGEGW